jgi:hypothetical protein
VESIRFFAWVESKCPQPITSSSGSPSWTASQETVDNSIYAIPDVDPLVGNSTPDANPVMVVGPFPSLNSVREINEFDGSVEKLDDFLTSVEAPLMAYNKRLKKDGYGSDADESWTFVSVAKYRETVANFKLNYNHGTRFCALLGERFTGAAREWWINRQNADGSKPDCWRAAAPKVINRPMSSKSHFGI